MISDGIAALLPRAAELGVRLGVEPLHPMFWADRCAVDPLADALDLAGAISATGRSTSGR
jgi:sugar phosphate isomerase/epimerase